MGRSNVDADLNNLNDFVNLLLRYGPAVAAFSSSPFVSALRGLVEGLPQGLTQDGLNGAVAGAVGGAADGLAKGAISGDIDFFKKGLQSYHDII